MIEKLKQYFEPTPKPYSYRMPGYFLSIHEFETLYKEYQELKQRIEELEKK